MNSKDIVVTVFGMAFKIIVAIVVVMLVYKYSVTGYDYGYRLFGEKPISSGEGRDISVTIPVGADASDIGEILENKGLIRDANLFVLQELVSEYKDLLKPGVYELNTAMTAEAMMEIMAAESESAEDVEDTPSEETEEPETQTETE